MPAAPTGPEPSTSADPSPAPTAFEVFGGTETFHRLVSRFYEGVAQDEVLRPMYPEEDLGPAAAAASLDLPARQHAALWDDLERAAHAMVNRVADPTPDPGQPPLPVAPPSAADEGGA